MRLTFDHFVISAASLDEGVAWLEERLQVKMAGGGKHAAMGTHNRLLGLGDLYLEVIATDPAAAAPERARWFGLDHFKGPPRLSHWVARCDDLEAALSVAPEGCGTPLALARGDYRWQMAVPASGFLPYDGAYPALIAWEGATHPAAALPDSGLRLETLEIGHPEAQHIADILAPEFRDARIAFIPAPAFSMRAKLKTAEGKTLWL